MKKSHLLIYVILLCAIACQNKRPEITVRESHIYLPLPARFDLGAIRSCLSLSSSTAQNEDIFFWAYELPSDNVVLRCFNLRSGEVWLSSDLGEYAEPFFAAIDSANNLLFASGIFSRFKPSVTLYSIDRMSGNVLWKKEVAPMLSKSKHRILTVRNTLCVALDHSVLCLDEATAEPIWKVAFEQEQCCAIAFQNDTLFLLTTREIVAINPADGTKLWHVRLESTVVPAQNTQEDFLIAGKDYLIFFTMNSGRVVHYGYVDTLERKVRWNNSAPADWGTFEDLLNAPSIFKDVLYLALSQSVSPGESHTMLLAVQLENGKIIWQKQYKRWVRVNVPTDSSPMYIVPYPGSRDRFNKVTFLDPLTGNVLFQYDISYSIHSFHSLGVDLFLCPSGLLIPCPELANGLLEIDYLRFERELSTTSSADKKGHAN